MGKGQILFKYKIHIYNSKGDWIANSIYILNKLNWTQISLILYTERCNNKIIFYHNQKNYEEKNFPKFDIFISLSNEGF